MKKPDSFKVCVFCGSKNGNTHKYLETAYKIGKELSKRNYSVIYGGGKFGLMGALAKGVIANQGNLISIIPKYFQDKNIFLENAGEIIFTKDFFDIKKNMINFADIFLVLPGGFGTLDELFEVISLNQLRVINKKIVLLDIKNFWKPLEIMIKDLSNKGFLYTNNNVFFKDSVNKAIEFIENNL